MEILTLLKNNFNGMDWAGHRLRLFSLYNRFRGTNRDDTEAGGIDFITVGTYEIKC